LPLQRREAVVEIDWDEIPAYITTFCHINTDNEQPPKVLQVRLANASSSARHTLSGSRPPVDILPLLRMHANHSAFNCHIVTAMPSRAYQDRQHFNMLYNRWAEYQKNLNELLRHSHPTWLADIQAGLFQSVHVYLEGQYYDEIHMVCHSDVALRCIGDSRLGRARFAVAGGEYLKSVGLRKGFSLMDLFLYDIKAV